MIDTHHHLWQYHAEQYAWIGEEMKVLQRDYLPEELSQIAAETGIRGTIAVQARQTDVETEWLLDVANRHPLICGVVGWLDLRSERLVNQLEAFTLHKKLVGLRHVLQEEGTGFMEQPSFLRGIKMLGHFGLAYDLLIYPEQLEEAIRLVARFPEQTFVLDHMAKPPVRDGVIQPWKKDIETLAQHPHVWCKISGLVTEADPVRRKDDIFLPYLEVVDRAFGTDRIMVGSDWPVCRLVAEYGEVISIPRRYFKGHEPADQRRVFHDNALRCYGLQC
jgi:L-fuconolactonase